MLLSVVVINPRLNQKGAIMKRVFGIAIAGMMLAMASTPAMAVKAMQWDYVYHYVFYSDAAMTTIVAFDQDTCYEFEGNVWVVTPQFPTPYYTSSQGEICRPGGPD